MMTTVMRDHQWNATTVGSLVTEEVNVNSHRNLWSASTAVKMVICPKIVKRRKDQGHHPNLVQTANLQSTGTKTALSTNLLWFATTVERKVMEEASAQSPKSQSSATIANKKDTWPGAAPTLPKRRRDHLPLAETAARRGTCHLTAQSQNQRELPWPATTATVKATCHVTAQNPRRKESLAKCLATTATRRVTCRETAPNQKKMMEATSARDLVTTTTDPLRLSSH